MPKDPEEIGALWTKTSARGEYMTGVIAGQRVVVFANATKGNEKAPNWRVLKAKPRDEKPEPDGIPDPRLPDESVPW